MINVIRLNEIEDIFAFLHPVIIQEMVFLTY